MATLHMWLCWHMIHDSYHIYIPILVNSHSLESYFMCWTSSVDTNKVFPVLGVSHVDLENFGKMLWLFLSGLGVVDGGKFKLNMSKGQVNVWAEKKWALQFGKGMNIWALLMVRWLVLEQVRYKLTVWQDEICNMFKEKFDYVDDNSFADHILLSRTTSMNSSMEVVLVWILMTCIWIVTGVKGLIGTKRLSSS